MSSQMSMKPNEVILISILNACTKLANEHAKKLGKEILRQFPKIFLEHEKLMTSAIDMLMKFGDVADAEYLFQTIKIKHPSTYGAMMKG